MSVLIAQRSLARTQCICTELFILGHTNPLSMPVNKNALIRYLALDQCFANYRRKYFASTLFDACNEALLEADPKSNGIQLRQLYADIGFIDSDAGYRITLDKLKEGKKTYYRYKAATFSINRQPLNQAELERVRSAIQALTRLKGMPQFEWRHELAPKLNRHFC